MVPGLLQYTSSLAPEFEYSNMYSYFRVYFRQSLVLFSMRNCWIHSREGVKSGQVEKQDTSGNERERERECESETVDHVIVVVLVFVLESDFKGRTNTNFS